MDQSVEKGWRGRLTIPSYRIGEAASYARISPSTVSAWHNDRTQKSVLSSRKDGKALSFLQLIEVAVVAEMRREGLKLPVIRAAREDMIRETGLDFPFARLKFKTDGADILRDVEGPLGKALTDRLLVHNRGGQYLWSEVIQAKLRTFNYDDTGTVVTWKVAGPEKEIEIDPSLAFGAPQIEGVKTSLLKTRFSIGEDVEEIADDYSLEEGQVVEALLFEGLDRENPRLAKWIH